MNNPDITKVYLLSVPLESDYKHTLYFTSAANQQSYFQSKIVKSYTDFSYQRKDKVIRVPDSYDKIYNCNYVMYQNSAYSNKWFYAFIEKLEYISDGRCDVHIKTDVIQTWLFDYNIKTSFVEREHVNNDTVGLHTVPEGLETGEYIVQAGSVRSGYNDVVSDLWYLQDTYICIAHSDIRSRAMQLGKEYNGVYSGLNYVLFKTPTDADRFIKDINDEVTEDPIYSIFMVPKNLFEIASSDWQTSSTSPTYEYCYVPNSSDAKLMGEILLTKPERLDTNYVPKNKKLLTYPYCYLLMSNNGGSVQEYKYEQFNNTNHATFKLYGAISVGCSIKLYPTGYNTKSPEVTMTNVNYVEGLDAYKLPTCSWNSDSYTNWLTQNSVNFPLSTVSNVGSIAAGVTLAVATGGTMAMVGGAMALGGVAGILEQVKTKYEHQLAPLTAQGGVNQGDLNFAQHNTYEYYKMSIRKEYAEIIDGYFDMFGYKVNTVKVPNKAHRSRYWYTKTIDVNIDGNIPNEDMQEIKNCYNNGITFWRNASEIQNYSLSNNIV